MRLAWEGLEVLLDLTIARALPDDDSGERAAAVLQKPCDPDVLVETLYKARKVRMPV